MPDFDILYIQGQDTSLWYIIYKITSLVLQGQDAQTISSETVLLSIIANGTKFTIAQNSWNLKLSK